jgi:hypothetical protein
VANAVAAPQDEPCKVAVPRNAVGNCCGELGKHALYLSPFCHHFNQTNVHYNPFPANCQEEKFEKSEKKTGILGTFHKNCRIIQNLSDNISRTTNSCYQFARNDWSEKERFRSGLLGMSRRQIKVF